MLRAIQYVSPFFGSAALSYLQIRQMVVDWWLLDALRVYGLDSGMIRNVHYSLFQADTGTNCHASYASSAASQTGYPVCDAGRVWDLFGSGGQG